MKEYEKQAIRFVTDKIIEMNNPDVNLNYSVRLIKDSVEFEVSALNENGETLLNVKWNINASDPITYLRIVEEMIKHYSKEENK